MLSDPPVILSPFCCCSTQTASDIGNLASLEESSCLCQTNSSFLTSSQKPSSNYPAFQGILWLANMIPSLQLARLLFLSKVQGKELDAWMHFCGAAYVYMCVCVSVTFTGLTTALDQSHHETPVSKHHPLLFHK